MPSKHTFKDEEADFEKLTQIITGNLTALSVCIIMET